jgi:hypothetical protein
VADEPRHLAAAVGALAVDERLRSRVDRDDAVELAEDRVLRGPEPHGACDRLGECGVGVRELDDPPDRQEGGVLVEALADRVDELQARAEVLVERRPGDPRAVGDLLDGRLVEGPLRHELGDGRRDLPARLVALCGAAAGAVGASRHDMKSRHRV